MTRVITLVWFYDIHMKTALTKFEFGKSTFFTQNIRDIFYQWKKKQLEKYIQTVGGKNKKKKNSF